MLSSLITLALIAGAGLLLINRASIRIWSISYAIVALLWVRYGSLGLFGKVIVTSIFVVLVAGSIYSVRRKLLSIHLFKLVSKVMPNMSSTERVALEAGTVGWEKDLFSGRPDFSLLLNAPTVALTKEEQAFIDGPVNTLCAMVDDWDITHNRTDLPLEVWTYLKEQGFFGLIIPRTYGGLELSASAVMSVTTKLYGRSVSVATTVGVPNSLGPAELLLKYGTEQQKDYYLPRLANGTEIPCFALTSPNAGSDAASIPDKGIVCYHEVDGEKVLGVRLNWDKRYITLCPAATIIGLAFRLFDPDHLIGTVDDVGITCALIPSTTPGVTKGRRHYPLNIAFLNGPTQGMDVFVPIDSLIGGEKMAGQGWQMLMECLSAGRAISLPSSASGGSQAAALVTGAYARIRKQFNLSIGKFEGIEEAMARIAGNTYIIDASLTMTAAAIDHGVKSGVAGAILKYHTTELARQVSLDSMDIHGGKGICLGPNNYLARGYQASPISITVEGANILTRSLIIFGQGAVRCHPYVLQEMESVRKRDFETFDKAIWGHFSFILANLTQSLLFAFTDARWTKAPTSYVKRYYQILHRYSANMAFLADFSVILLGAKLKRKESLSARLGDILSNMYLASGVLKRFHDAGEPTNELPLVDWCCQQLFYRNELAIQGIINNFPSRWSRAVLKLILRPFGSSHSQPCDRLGRKLASLMMQPNEVRSKLSRLVYAEANQNCPIGRLEAAFHKICASEEIEKKVADAVKKGKLHTQTLLEQIEEARSLGILDTKEALQLQQAEQLRQEIIAVDDFANQDLARQLEPVEAKAKKKVTSQDKVSVEAAGD